jgi:hypothetical protein
MAAITGKSIVSVYIVYSSSHRTYLEVFDHEGLSRVVFAKESVVKAHNS